MSSLEAYLGGLEEDETVWQEGDRERTVTGPKDLVQIVKSSVGDQTEECGLK